MQQNYRDGALNAALEREELEAVLAYPPIARCPNLTKVLRYLCELHFAGKECQIREYNIGTEALGRPLEFQPRLDPIVRVVVSRLRKRLSAFYEGEGRVRPVRITVPPGQYLPRFELAVNPQVCGAATQIDGCQSVNGHMFCVTECNPNPTKGPADKHSLTSVDEHSQLEALSGEQPLGSPAGEADQRAEFDALLGSQTLRRSPRLLRLAEYMGQAYFSRTAGPIKEYSIAVDALGRPADFDSKQDSIVRVEAYRLRKKLDRYYETEGRHRALRIVLDPGQYLPRFVKQSIAEAVGPENQAPPSLEQVSPAELPRAVPPRIRLPRLIAALAASLLIVAALYNFAQIGEAHASARPATIRVIAGAPAIQFATSPLGFVWLGDRWFSGGSTIFGSTAAVSLPEATVHTERLGNFEYAIPLSRGTYELRLYFAPRLIDADTLDQRQTMRFDVFMNGAKIMDALEAPSVRNPNSSWTVRVFKNAGPDRDGKLHIVFRNRDDIAYVSGIEVGQGMPNRLMPIRMVAKSSSLTDRQGRVWSFEQYVHGGTLVSRSERLSGRMEDNLLSSERYGNFSYAIPVAPGRYRLRLHFAETWFDPAQGRGGVGSRKFDVYINGSRVLKEFDILHEAGRSYVPVVKEFAGLLPTPDWHIYVQFDSRSNFACLNALELLDESNQLE